MLHRSLLSIEQMLSKEISVLLTDSREYILQRAYDKARTRVRSAVNIVIEQTVLDVVKLEIIDKIRDKHIANYFITCDATDKIG